jgi:ornithine decarboxylase
MEFFRRFTFLVCAPAFDPEDLEGHRLGQITAAIEKLGFQVVRARRIEDAEIAVQTDAAIGCMVVDWGKKGLEGKTAALINLMRRRGLEMPIVMLVRRKRFEDIPVEVLDYIDGYIFLAEETPEFIATNLVSRLKQYAETLKTPFFGALVDYAERGNQLWTCPGHNGGIFYNRSPIGRIFVEHLGNAVFHDDLDNSVLELGDLLVHEGPALKAQQEAAAIFGAEKTYFVLNGTSSSNKIVLSALVADRDLVLFDRNNHKAAHHGALFIGGGIPIFLETDRNAYGLIGPIFHEAFDEARIRDKIRNHPLVRHDIDLGAVQPDVLVPLVGANGGLFGFAFVHPGKRVQWSQRVGDLTGGAHERFHSNNCISRSMRIRLMGGHGTRPRGAVR